MNQVQVMKTGNPASINECREEFTISSSTGFANDHRLRQCNARPIVQQAVNGIDNNSIHTCHSIVAVIIATGVK
jgi:hypothetical protein